MKVYYWAARNKIVIGTSRRLIEYCHSKSNWFIITHTYSRMPKTLVLLGDLYQ